MPRLKRWWPAILLAAFFLPAGGRAVTRQRRALRWGGLTLAVVVLWVWLSLATGQFN